MTFISALFYIKAHRTFKFIRAIGNYQTKLKP